MLKNSELVFEKAEEMAEKYRQKLLAEAEGLTWEEMAASEEAAATEEITATEEETQEDLEEEMVGAVDE
jgi:small subunit ribosomal protein S1